MQIVANDHASIAAMSVEALRAEFTRQIEVTARSVERLALIWRELEARGEDMSVLRTGIATYLPAVASGRLVPEAVVRLAGNRSTLRAVSCLAPDEQRRVLSAEHVAIAAMVDGKRTVTNKPLHLLTPVEASRAFDVTTGAVIPADRQKVAGPKRASLTTAESRLVLMVPRSVHDKLHEAARAKGLTVQRLILNCLRENDIIN
jgi:hypothetical protein